MKSPNIPRHLLILVFGLVTGFAPLVSPVRAAESETETKIRLMADALRARDNGDLATAKSDLQQLQKIAPDDANVKRLLNQVEQQLQQAQSAPAPSQTSSGNDASASSAPDATQVDPVERSIQKAKDIRDLARKQAARGDTDLALATYDFAINSLVPDPRTNGLISSLKVERDQLANSQSNSNNSNSSSGQSGGSIASTFPVGAGQGSENVSPDRDYVANLVKKGRSQFLAGSYDASVATFKQVETIDPENVAAKAFLARIAEMRTQEGAWNRKQTENEMMQEVTNSWQRPGVYNERPVVNSSSQGQSPLAKKLDSIMIPNVDFNGVELSKVISTLSQVSSEYDKSSSSSKGVNIVLIDPTRANPKVNITLRNLPLKRVLDFVTDSVGYQYEVESDAVVVRPGGDTSNLDTQFFPVSRSTVIRMTGNLNPQDNKPATSNDPFARKAGGGQQAPSDADEIRDFLQQAGVNFEGVKGASLAYDGSSMIVTQTPRNLQRIRNILNRYNDVRQVEIEAKFMEVNEGALNELGVQWNAQSNNGQTMLQTQNRSLQGAFGTSNNSSSQLQIVQPNGQSPISLPIVPPSLPGGVNLGSAAGAAGAVGVITRTISNFSVDAIVRALSQESGTDLLSSPKVTVLSGNPASITVAQEFRYPQSYSKIESQVGTGNNSGGGSAGVTITTGTPENFKTQNVGVQLTVTPTVEDDDYSISLDLNPKVTEFEGFVEYGGPSVAISGGTNVTVPSGFFQPIFSVREVHTKVTIWDGATVVMGGLTREEVKKVHDKVPVLGDVPLIGRFFRSEGESTQKRNLLIFVTANLVSPGGSPKRENLRGVPPDSLFQNPTVVTPSGPAQRVRK